VGDERSKSSFVLHYFGSLRGRNGRRAGDTRFPYSFDKQGVAAVSLIAGA